MLPSLPLAGGLGIERISDIRPENTEAGPAIRNPREKTRVIVPRSSATIPYAKPPNDEEALMHVLNPSTKDFQISVSPAYRPILLLGLSTQTEYVREFTGHVEASLRRHGDIRGFGGVVNIRSIHFFPNEPIEQVIKEGALLRAWIRQKDPAFVATWADVESFKGPAARMFLEVYAEFVDRLEDREFDVRHGACFEMTRQTSKVFDKAKKNPAVQRVRHASSKRADNREAIYVPVREDVHVPLLGPEYAAIAIAIGEGPPLIEME